MSVKLPSVRVTVHGQSLSVPLSCLRGRAVVRRININLNEGGVHGSLLSSSPEEAPVDVVKHGAIQPGAVPCAVNRTLFRSIY